MRLRSFDDESTKKTSKTEVLHGIENSLSIGLEFMQNAKNIGVIRDKKGPSILIENDFYKKNWLKQEIGQLSFAIFLISLKRIYTIVTRWFTLQTKWDTLKVSPED